MNARYMSSCSSSLHGFVVGTCHLPVPVLIPCDEIRIQLCLVFGESHAIALEDGFVVYMLQGDSALHTSHGGDELGEAIIAIHIVGRKKVFLSSDARDLKHRSDVGFGIVLLGRRPSGEDVPNRESSALCAEALVVGLEDAPCSPITIGHALELYKTLVCLFFRCTLPFIGRVTDI